MKALFLALLVTLAVVPAAFAAEPVTATLKAPLDRAWTTTEAVLKQLGWDIDKSDRSIGWITTDSRRVEGEDYGVYAKGMRHRLQIHLKAAGEGRTTISIERTVFDRERILWMDKDRPVTTTDQTVEKRVLAAIEQSL